MRIVCVGEGMLELSRKGDSWRLGYGGDTLNTAIHLARMGNDVAYLTALGSDSFSQDMKRQWAAEGLDVSGVLTHPTRQAGLYAIDTDDTGERSFTYWRDTSAAREMFALPESEAAAEQATAADLLYFSLITLALLPPEGRERLLTLARQASRVAFDGNYRPRLWASGEEARHARDAAIGIAEIGLPTLDDEEALSASATKDSVFTHWQRSGCAETIVKIGAQGCRLPDGRIVAPEQTLATVDTSGAGDAFNAGYIDARLRGVGIQEAAKAGHALAAWTIMRPGAIPPAGS